MPVAASVREPVVPCPARVKVEPVEAIVTAPAEVLQIVTTVPIAGVNVEAAGNVTVATALTTIALPLSAATAV